MTFSFINFLKNMNEIIIMLLISCFLFFIIIFIIYLILKYIIILKIKNYFFFRKNKNKIQNIVKCLEYKCDINDIKQWKSKFLLENVEIQFIFFKYKFKASDKSKLCKNILIILSTTVLSNEIINDVSVINYEDIIKSIHNVYEKVKNLLLENNNYSIKLINLFLNYINIKIRPLLVKWYENMLN